MKILISNDDGVYAPGLNRLAEEMAKIAEIDVVAPDRNRSGASNSLTLTRPLRVRKMDNGFYSVDGTPTDCVHIALTGLLESMPDVVVSGINHGGNLGDDILYSGTVAAAMEGRFLGLPAIAFSLMGESYHHFDSAAKIASRLVSKLRPNLLPAHIILNVNIPDLSLEEIKGIQVTRLGTRHVAESTIQETDPRGRPIYWIGPPGLEADAGPGTDFYALNQGHVSITPLTLDMTHYAVFDKLANWIGEWDRPL